MKQKPTIPSGTRDFGPAEVARRNYIIDTIKQVYELYGYQPLETPVMENLSTLTGKYGDEGDKLLFKILNSGDFLKDTDPILLNERNSNKILSSISEKGLRYDLTVPFARYVVMHQNEITFPFKRYQIQPVWRADRPQKGRYREFYQCDADVIGSNSLLNELELIQIIDDVFQKLKIKVDLKINNRKILYGVAEALGHKDKVMDIVNAIDLYEKLGKEGIDKELSEKGFSEPEIWKILQIILVNSNRVYYPSEYYSEDLNLNKLLNFKDNSIVQSNDLMIKGVQELEYLIECLKQVNLKSINITFDLTLARGLNYYTGIILEAKANDVKMGSILGGGRYDDLTGIFGLPNMSGVGISFGLDRIYDVINELNLFPESALTQTQVLIIPFDADAEIAAINYAKQLRSENIKTEIYPDLNAKTGKKFKYADDKKIPYTAVIGSNEMAEEKLSLKNMQSGEQRLVSIEELIAELNNEMSGYFDVSE